MHLDSGSGTPTRYFFFNINTSFLVGINHGIRVFFDLLPFCFIFVPTIFFSFIFSTLGTLLYIYNIIFCRGSALIINSLINRLTIKKIQKQEFTHFVFANIFENAFLLKFTYIFLHHFSTVFCRLLDYVSFKYFRNRFEILKYLVS